MCSWSVDKFANASQQQALFPVVAASISAATVTLVIYRNRVRSLRKQKKVLRTRVTQLETELKLRKNNNVEINTIQEQLREQLRISKTEISDLEREIKNLVEMGRKAAQKERELETQMISMTSAFADEFRRNQRHDEEILLKQNNLHIGRFKSSATLFPENINGKLQEYR